MRARAVRSRGAEGGGMRRIEGKRERPARSAGDRWFVFWAALLVAAGATGAALAYQTYSENRDATNCRACHGDFRSNHYISNTDGQDWGNLHNIHRYDMLDGECDACHKGGKFPVRIGESSGVANLPPYGCSGCHGRAEDGSGTGTQGFGAGLRQHHWRAGVTECGLCHPDADPASYTPVGETVLPPYYGKPGWPRIPKDPCNPPPDYTENKAGALEGLDNDGDLSYDTADPDCGPSATPGEVSGGSLAQMTAERLASGAIHITYAPACAATDNVIEYGPLDQVASYAYSGQECAIGNSGSYDWMPPSSPASLFFVVVANDGSVEGSYGVDSGGAERPEDTSSTLCPFPQDLANRCD
ncbi:MAG: hypothetical protein D6718_09740 [Acidobacteria bacterium]|nr:MAG: hypothetical protein D6718_09740 [Acidobacteriota bacterium]